ncbi:hypothetical protein CVT24_011003 [Panaeolus cyanescens]|uniref:Uncharacterized protein n=1 Tax=Panaeolus cyanescens TaxID=181874 RepID=A0A409YV93_9AGAR|nr:hypothetical protein CVT24_011003 [Panaeolus cyanescens]
MILTLAERDSQEMWQRTPAIALRREDIITPFETAQTVPPPSYTKSTSLIWPLASKDSPTRNGVDSPSSEFEVTEGGRDQSICTNGSHRAGLYAAPYPIENATLSAWGSDTPPSFSRAAPSHLSYPNFDSIHLVSKANSLDKGFPLTAPSLEVHADYSNSANAHPFISHDITERDWLQLIQLIQSTATLNDRDIERSQPMILAAIPIVGESESAH